MRDVTIDLVWNRIQIFITALGGFGIIFITALTSQNTLGVHGVHAVPVDFIRAQFDAVMSDIGADAVKTGMLGSSDVIEAVADLLHGSGRPALVVDPVLRAMGGAPIFYDGAQAALFSRLLPLATIVTPNIPEAEVLCAFAIPDLAAMHRAAAAIHALGAQTVVIKGGHLEQGDAIDVFYDGSAYSELPAPRLATKNTHGTGCTFAAACATALGQGQHPREAVSTAKRFVTEAIRHALPLGHGHGPTNHAFVFQQR